MLSLAGFPATVGFFGKIYLIEAAVDNDYAFLGVAIVLGSAISLGVLPARGRGGVADGARGVARAPAAVGAGAPRPAIAGGSQEADGLTLEPARTGGHGLWAIGTVAVVCATATIAFGIYPEPLFNVAEDAGRALTSLL